MDSKTPAVDVAAMVRQITAGVTQRIMEADDEARESNIAFAAGRFGDYYKEKYEEIEGVIEDEFDSNTGSPPVGGDGEEGG